MPDFKTQISIIVQPQDSGVPYKFTLTVCSSATLNDGALPYGTTISSAVVTAHTQAGVDASSDLIVSSTLVGLIITVKVKYPTAKGEGEFHLTFVLTLSDSSVIEFDFNRVLAMNK